ncbi:MAG: pyrroline-5-carboxylate reductase [Clostridia bacterium]|nr:pyrroline-5-carboxylate reductase [Clostridia bacterium]MBO5300104.1 pyrroline-5-carboxylate reductase [Clostridia bacterium]MBQ2720053.1 pyrroline-5-carboxylate reductase [Clostridia bacterium]
MNFKIGFIGAGHMAKALIFGLVGSGAYDKREILIYDTDAAKLENYRQAGFRVASSETEVMTNATFVFLAVRPGDLVSVLKKTAPVITVGNVLISVAAGVSISFIKKYTRPECKVVRIMPNTAAQVCLGATALSYDMPVTYSELTAVREMLENLGVVEILPEDRMNEVISLNSSSPVYVYMLARAMIDGAKNQGIEEDTARRLAVQTILGAAKMLDASEEDISKMISDVCTPNGTTIKAVDYLEKRGFEQALADAMLTCTKRANLIEREIEN